MKTRNAVIMVMGVAIVAVIASLHISSNGLWLSSKSKSKPSRDLTIDFKVANSGTELEITNPNCRIDNSKGCFEIRRGWRGLIKYVFKGHEEYRLTEYKICEGIEKSDSPCSLDLAERLDFFVSDDTSGSNVFMTNSEGEIDLSKLNPLASGKTEFYFIDQNSIRNDYFYQIEACIPDTNNCINTDPQIVNKGRN
jgi:hypothetical protein